MPKASRKTKLKAKRPVPEGYKSMPDAATYISKSKSWLAQRSHKAEGPPVTWRHDPGSKFMRALYKVSELDTWLKTGKPVNDPARVPASMLPTDPAKKRGRKTKGAAPRVPGATVVVPPMTGQPGIPHLAALLAVIQERASRQVTTQEEMADNMATVLRILKDVMWPLTCCTMLAAFDDDAHKALRSISNEVQVLVKSLENKVSSTHVVVPPK